MLVAETLELGLDWGRRRVGVSGTYRYMSNKEWVGQSGWWRYGVVRREGGKLICS
jgi:hypothetical protein